jgi:DNA-binding HxlR family transcriptional regulator
VEVIYRLNRSPKFVSSDDVAAAENRDANSMSTHSQEFGEKSNCPNWGQNDLALAIARTLYLVSGKWKIHILGQLILGPVRYNKLNRLLPQMSSKVLTQQLQALERDALIYRECHGILGKRVNYTITAQGARLWNNLALIGRSEEDPTRRGTLDSIRDGRDMTYNPR